MRDFRRKTKQTKWLWCLLKSFSWSSWHEKGENTQRFYSWIVSTARIHITRWNQPTLMMIMSWIIFLKKYSFFFFLLTLYNLNSVLVSLFQFFKNFFKLEFFTGGKWFMTIATPQKFVPSSIKLKKPLAFYLVQYIFTRTGVELGSFFGSCLRSRLRACNTVCCLFYLFITTSGEKSIVVVLHLNVINSFELWNMKIPQELLRLDFLLFFGRYVNVFGVMRASKGSCHTSECRTFYLVSRHYHFFISSNGSWKC